MRSQTLIMSVIVVFLFELISCKTQKAAIKPCGPSAEYIEPVKLEFEILTDRVYLQDMLKINDYGVRAYFFYEIIATLKQTNRTKGPIMLNDFVVYENYEIINVKEESRDDLIASYDYSIIPDPETYELLGDSIVEPDQHIIDSLNLAYNFKFDLCEPETFMIRIKKQYFEKELYSNWDTLIIQR